MRVLFSVLMVLGFGFSASGSVDVGPNSTWDEINQAGLWAKFPRIEFAAGEKSVQVPVINTCVTGGELLAKTPYSTVVLSKALSNPENETYSVPVVQNFGAGHGNEKIAFVKTFTPPICN